MCLEGLAPLRQPAIEKGLENRDTVIIIKMTCGSCMFIFIIYARIWKASDDMAQVDKTLRLQQFQNRLAFLGIDGALLVNARDIFYYCGTAQPAILLITPADYRLMVRKGLEFALVETWMDKGRLVAGGIGDVRDHLVAMGVRGGRLGLETDVMSADLFLRVQRLLPEFLPVSVTREILIQRMIKDQDELGLIRHACAIMQIGHDRVFEVLKPGMSELELAAEIEYAHRRAGHEGAICIRISDYLMVNGPLASGENLYRTTGWANTITGVGLSSAITAGPSLRPIQPGDIVMADIPVYHQGYHCDESRTYVLGEPKPGISALHASLREIVDSVLEEMKPGTRCSDLFHVANDCAQRLGVGDYFLTLADRKSPLIGHGVGLEVNELPVLEAHSDLELQANMVTTLEMHLTHPQHGVVKTEFMVLVTPDGYERLSVKGCELFVVDN